MKRNYAIRILFWLLITSNTFAQVIEMPDPNLRHAVRQALRLPDEIAITQTEMLRLKHLEVRDKQITDLTGLEYAANLTYLLFIETRIQDLNPLAGLFNLEELHIRHSRISDISPLENLTQLRRLKLAGGQLKNLNTLPQLPQLTQLSLQNNQISDITSLSNQTQLIELNLTGNRIVDVSPLTNLTALEELYIYRNPIIDYSPLDGLSLIVLERDYLCESATPPIEPRIENRNFPSIAGFDSPYTRPHLSRIEQYPYYDLVWDITQLGLDWKKTVDGYRLAGDIAEAKAKRDELLAKNPNLLLIVANPHRDGILNLLYPEDFPYWIRDENGNRVPAALHKRPGSPQAENVFNEFLVDFTHPDVQDIIVQRAVAVAKCGLFDGMITEWWIEKGYTLAEFSNWRKAYSTPEAELQARLSIIQRIRAEVPDDFLIMVNLNRRKIPLTAPYINGGFMEILPDYEGGYTREGVLEIEDTLRWLDTNLRQPRINAPRPAGIPTEPPDSPTNRRWMRLFTTMSLTVSDGYVLYTTGVWFSYHIWYDFWDADLGRPVGPKAQPYQNIDGLFIREFTNGWAVYNRSGKEQAVTLPRASVGVSSDKRDVTHLLPDLDGEIYLRVGKPFDLNRDGTVNVLDLIIVSEAFGTTEGDVNGDGITNILDLTLVAQQFSRP